MNCHGNHGINENNGNNNGHGKKSHISHMLLMILCCAIPVVLIALLPLLKINNAAIKSILPFAAFLLCPLMHILMMIPMFIKDKNEKKNRENAHIESDRHR